MPDEKGKLSPEEQQKAVAWINAKSGESPCPSCGQNRFTLGSHLISPLALGNGKAVTFGTSIPTVYKICNNCGLLLYYSAVMMGLHAGQAGEVRADGK